MPLYYRPVLKCVRDKPLSNFSIGTVRCASTQRFRSMDMDSKTDKIRAAWGAGDQIGALRIAARFFDRSFETRTFKRGMDAHNNPAFYRQLGKDPAQIIAGALDVLARRFSLR
jgi:hypothetical protein